MFFDSFYSNHLSITFFVIAIVLAIVFRIMIMLAVGFDCKAAGVKSRSAWMALAFFVPISAIVYVCIRKSLDKTVPKHCNSCGAMMPPGTAVCSNCGSARLSDYVVADSAKKKKSALVCLIIGLIMYVACSVFYCLGAVSMIRPLVEDYYNNGNGYYDNFDDYGNYDDYDDFFDYYDEDDYFDDYSDYFSQLP
ncbi:MAG: hypothetical protein ACLUFN_10515 [Eubacterium sp.]